jgi:L-lactate dehydrogenase complex protein LldG
VEGEADLNDPTQVMEKVRRSLGRGRGASAPVPPAPPELPDPIVRLVGAGADLAEVFAKNAGALKMKVLRATRDGLSSALLEFLRDKPVHSIALSDSPLLDNTQVKAALESAKFSVKSWDQLTLDQMYEFDCAITTVDYAVAESGTFVINPSTAQGRSMSLVPMYHIAIIQKQQILPDMIDLFQKLAADPNKSNSILISGPSKTADIEMNVVTGVHGPNVVAAFIVD